MKPSSLMLAGWLLASGWAGPAAFAADTPALTDCRLAGPYGLDFTKARCGTLAVPEDPAAPDGRRIELNLAVIPADAPEPATSAVALLAGGPGQAATEAFPSMPGLLANLSEDRDVLLVDQRGTGESHPLDCPIETEELWDVEVDRDEVQAMVRRCLDGLEDTDPRFYTTPIAMDDLDRVREALGYQQLDLVGVSYGTRAAQVYMQRHPERVRSAVLAAAVPMDEYLGLAHAANLDRAVDAVFGACAETEACARKFGDPGAALDGLLQRVSGSPVELDLADPTTAELTTITVGRDAVAGTVRLLSYTPEGQALLPLLVSDAADSGSLDRLAAQALMASEQIMEQLSRGMELSVMCAEDVPFYPADWEPPEGAIMGRTLVDYARWSCQVWPRGEIPGDYHEPLDTDIPTLVLSGEFDPVTPPAWGERIAEGLDNARHLTVPGQSHALLGRGCVNDVVGRFINDAGFQELEAECLDDMGPMPFFIDFTGPAP